MLIRTVFAVIAGLGAHLATQRGAADTGGRPAASARIAARLTEHRRQVAPTIATACTGALGAHLLFGGTLAPVGMALATATVPGRLARTQRERERRQAATVWPRLIEEIRVLTTTAGRPIPSALFDAGRRAPMALRRPFAAAEREWLLTTDLGHSAALLADLLDDPGADAVLQTLVVAHELGGADLDQRLSTLSAHRTAELEARREAEAELAGVRFARRFVLLVPLGMAVAGQTIGPGRASYGTPPGQFAVALSGVVVAVCWWWAGRLMQVPEAGRVVAS